LTNSIANKVAVLCGGSSAERDISLVSGKAANLALQDCGYKTTLIDVRRDIRILVEAISETNPDVVFNALHGRYGEDGCIQGLLDLMAIPYTNSGRLASALAMNKHIAKQLFAKNGIPVAEYRVVTKGEAQKEEVLPRPYVIKPINEGSSVGVHLVKDGDDHPPLDELPGDDNTLIMVERYIPGREMTVAIMGDRPLAVTEIDTRRTFYDYTAKYAAGGSEHILPAHLDNSTYDLAMELSLIAHRSLDCRGLSRTDLRFDGTNFFVLEVNTQPGLTPTSLVPEQAAYKGISFSQLVKWMVENAQCDI